MFFKCADRLCDLYISYRQRYVLMEADGSIYIPKDANGDRPLSNKVVCGHLNQKYAVSVYAGKYSSKFMTFDVDDGKQSTVKKIIEVLVGLGLPRDRIYVSTSGGKGFHVDLFFDNLVYTDKLRILYDYVCIEGELDPVKVEFRPTHKQAIKLPLSRHCKTGNICWYLDRDTFEPIEHLDYILEIEKIPSEQILEIIGNLPLRFPIPIREDLDYKFSDKVPAKKIEAEDGDTYEFPILHEPGTRHTTMISIAVYCRSRGYTQEQIETLLIEWAEEQNPDFVTDPMTVVHDDAARLAEWVWRESFHIRSMDRKEVVITKRDVEKVLVQPTKTMRKLVFLLICHEKRFGSLSMSCERIGEFIGCTGRSAHSALYDLKSKNVINMVEGKVVAKHGEEPNSFVPVRMPNRYWTNEFYAPSLLIDDPIAVQTTISEKFEPETFVSLYYKTLAAICPESLLKDRLTKKELLEVENYEQSE